MKKRISREAGRIVEVGECGVGVKLGRMNAPAEDRGEIEMNLLIWL